MTDSNQANSTMAQERYQAQDESIANVDNYCCIKFPISKLSSVLDAIELEYINYFDSNLESGSVGITEFMRQHVSCWTNPSLTSGNTEYNDTVWLGFPNRGNISNVLSTDFLIQTEELNYDKHVGMLYWCGGDIDCVENDGERCPTCWHRVETA